MSQSRSGALCFAIAMAAGSVAAARRHRSNTTRLAIAGALMLLVVLSVVWSDVRMTDRFALRVDDSIRLRQRDLECHGANHPRLPPDRHGLNTFGTATLAYQVSHRTCTSPRPTTTTFSSRRKEASSDGACPGRFGLHDGISLAPVRRSRQPGRIVLAALGAVTGLMAVALQSFVDFSLQMPGTAVSSSCSSPWRCTAAIRAHLVMSVSPVATRDAGGSVRHAIAQVLRGGILVAWGAFRSHLRKALDSCCSCRCSARLASPSVKDRRQGLAHTDRAHVRMVRPPAHVADGARGSSSSSRSRTPHSSGRTR